MESSSPQAAPTEAKEPIWFRSHPWVIDAELYLRTLWLGLARPTVLVDRWLAGDPELVNPITFVVSTAAVVGFVLRAFGQLHPAGKSDAAAPSLWATAWAAIGPYVFYVAVALVMHALLRLLGGQRRLSSTLALTLLVGAATIGVVQVVGGMLMELAMWARGVTSVDISDPNATWREGLLYVALVFPLFGSVVWFWTSLGRALARLHGLGWRRTSAAVIAVALASCLAAEYVTLPLPQIVVGVHYDRSAAQHWTVNFGARLSVTPI